VAGPRTAASEWAETVMAAKREGRVILIGPNTAEAREALTRGFEQKYPEIQVQYTGDTGGSAPAKILAERQGGQYLQDVLIGGTSTHYQLIGVGAVDSVWPYLLGPETQDRSVWLGGELAFSDNAAQYNLVLANIFTPTITYNPTLVAPGEIRSFKDLLHPRWKGKLVMYDPRIAGTGNGMSTFFYTTESLGKEYLRQLFVEQGVAFSRDARQIVDWVVRGHYAIEVSGSQQIVADLRTKGVQVEMLGGKDMEEGSYLSAGPASLGVINRAPHPNATKVYLDYLLSREGQTAFARGVGFASRRTDVPADHVPEILVPNPNVPFKETYKESYSVIKQEVSDYLRALLGS
jgi:iron(III) transport system substrate-binding protein